MRFIQDPITKKMIPADEYVEKHGTERLTAKATNRGSAFFGDRHYENLPVMGGKGGKMQVVNSRKQHRQFMKENNLTTIDDFSSRGGAWDKQEKARQNSITGDKSRISDVVASSKKHGLL